MAIIDVVHLYRGTDQTPVWVNPNKIELFPHSCPLSKGNIGSTVCSIVLRRNRLGNNVKVRCPSERFGISAPSRCPLRVMKRIVIRCAYDIDLSEHLEKGV